MKPDEAIKILKDMLNRYRGYELPQDEATQLGIEALERLVWERRYGQLSKSKLLPSEGEK